MKKITWISVAIAVSAGLIAIPYLRLEARVTHHVDIVSETLSQSISDAQVHLNELVEGSSNLPAKFAELNCMGSDLSPPQKLTNDFVYVLNRTLERNFIRGFAHIEPAEDLVKPGWRKNRIAKRIPDMIKVCNGCELSRKYSFAIDKWEVEKKIEPVSYYEKRSVVGENRDQGWPSADASVDILVTWSKPSFNKVGTYKWRVKEGLYGAWKDDPDAELVVGYETAVTFCVYRHDDLSLIARKTITRPPPESPKPLSSRSEVPPNGISAADNDRFLAASFLMELASAD